MASVALIGLGLGLVGGVANLASSISAGNAQRSAAHDAEALARKNAAELQRRGAEEAELRRQEGRRLSARQRAMVGASGFRTDSFFDLLVDTATREELAAQRVQQRYSAEAGLELTRGLLESKGLRRQARATVIGGVTDFVGAAGSAATSYGYYKKTGVIP